MTTLLATGRSECILLVEYFTYLHKPKLILSLHVRMRYDIDKNTFRQKFGCTVCLAITFGF